MTAPARHHVPWTHHRRPVVLALHEQDGLLCAEQGGRLTPVYHFAPLHLAHQCGQCVPFAAQWPEHLKPFVYRYDPLPAQEGLIFPAHLAGRFGTQSRQGSGLRPWDQLLYQGWPLYLPASDLPAPPGHGLGLFEPVSTDLPALAQRRGHPTCGP
ncbi:hypothetical protein [Deinococcus fonticola]|uniref:hypothetical protein n=1 Tax=Deinococcus fonticola TaxID=2528713 RepID=UPI00107510D0|nr:hypothetical protein [Deinococcus fonticola]